MIKWDWKAFIVLFILLIVGCLPVRCQPLSTDQKLLGMSLRTCYTYLQDGNYDIRNIDDVNLCVSNDFLNAQNAHIATTGIKTKIPIANVILEAEGYMTTTMTPAGRFNYHTLDQWHQAVVYILNHPRTDEEVEP